ncbi:hypothetical protein HI914_01172 [Erysiphe necator]|nr:hypothetical protein HI914_01172 [Erysiphe necator]
MDVELELAVILGALLVIRPEEPEEAAGTAAEVLPPKDPSLKLPWKLKLGVSCVFWTSPEPKPGII